MAIRSRSTAILTVDGNGRVQPRRLAEFMRNAVANYAVPRSRLAEAKARDDGYNSTEAVAALVEQARRSFTDLTNTGEVVKCSSSSSPSDS